MKRSLLILQVMLFFCIANAQSNIDSALVASYFFNGNFADNSGHGYDAYNMGVYFGTDRFGNPQSAALFDGWSYLVLPDSVLFQPLTSSTVSLWIQTNEYQRMTVLEQRLGSGTPDDLNFQIGLNYPFPQYIHYVHPNYNGTPFAFTSFIVYGNLAVNSNWHHYVFIKDVDQSIMSVYEDDALLGFRPINDVPFQVNGTLLMGRNFNYEFFYRGMIDDVKIYNRAISPIEIDTLFREMVVVKVKNPAGSSFSVFPNPSTGIVNLPYLKDFGKIILGEVFTEDGKKMTIFNDYKKVDLSGYKTGNYLIVLTNEQGYKSTAKVNKQ
ncbi:MAG: LamG-like jellyroll fold domain-containing protein [Chloroflexota bacterium]